MYIIRLSQNWTGLCNQLFALANGIAERPASVDTVYITGFAPNLGSNVTVPVSKIIDLTETGKKLGLVLKDHIGPLTHSNSSFGWYTRNTAKFNNVLKCITFNKVLTDLCKDVYPNLVRSVKEVVPLSIVHFRIENDAIMHWSKQNKLAPVHFKKLLHDHYRKIINEHIPKSDTIIALTFDTDNELLKELSSAGYNITRLDSKGVLQNLLGFAGRESCAVLDLLLGEYCNNVFVGCHNFTLKRGSTFSYTLWQRMQNVRKGVFIDLDAIKNQPSVLRGGAP